MPRGHKSHASSPRLLENKTDRWRARESAGHVTIAQTHDATSALDELMEILEAHSMCIHIS